MSDNQNKNPNENNKYDIIETEAREITDDVGDIENAENSERIDESPKIQDAQIKKKNPVNFKFFFKHKILTTPIVVVIALSVFSLIIWSISAQSPKVADFFTNNISFAMRFILTGLTYYIPFSIAELILYICIPAAVYFIVKFIRTVMASKNEKIIAALRGLVRCIAFICGIIFIFTFTFGVCYSATPINEKVGFERRLLKPEDLSDAMQILIEQVNDAAENIEYIYTTGSTAMPYNLTELNNRLNEAYTKLLSMHDNITKQIKARVKPVILSEQLSKMHITGIYSPFTGEANLNIDFPDYHLPFTAAHEMAHLMGIAREDEANFVAFLVCLYSDDNYIRYSGLVNIISYLQSPLYQADADKYFEAMYTLDSMISDEMAAYREFFNKYRDTQISKVASTVNDTYLKAQRQEAGEKSYGLVVDLATVYILEIYMNINK